MIAKLREKPVAENYNELGVWFAGKEAYGCAAQAFATSLQTDPQQKDLPHVAFMFGVSLYFSGDIKEAIASLQEAEKLGYRDIKIHLVLAAALDAAHATADAEAEWRAALALDPETTNALDALSSDLISDGNFQATIELLESPRLFPQRTEQQARNLGQAYARSSKQEEAARVLEDALNTTPDSAALASQLADVLAGLHRREEAITILDVALARHPGDASLTAQRDKIVASLSPHH